MNSIDRGLVKKAEENFKSLYSQALDNSSKSVTNAKIVSLGADASAEELATILNAKNLHFSDISDRSAHLIAKYLPRSTVQNLKVDSGGSLIIEYLPPTLTELDLSANGLGQLDIEELMERHLPELRLLKLAKNDFTVEEIEIFADLNLPKLPKLQSLDISGNEIEDEGIIALAKRIPETLRSLNISNTQISALGVQALLNLKTVQVLDVRKNPIGDSAKKLLLAKFKHVRL